MGKKGSWFSAIKRVFTHSSKEKLVNESEKRGTREKKKKGLGKVRHGEGNSFIPLFREPSSIEKILGDAEREHQNIIYRPPSPLQQPKTPPVLLPRAASSRAASPRAASPRAASPRAASPRAASQHVASSRVASSRVVHHHKEIRHRPEPTLRNHHASAVRIQAAYRGYMARRSFRALRGLVRLQGVIRGQNVKRQTVNAMKHMQLLVRVQTQIQSRRIQILENQALQRQNHYKNYKEEESTLGKWSLASEAGNHENWDDSVLTKEEMEARIHRKVEAMVKRERAMAYSYSHQLWKATPKAAQGALMDLRSGGFPWWWNWLERQLPPNSPSNQPAKNVQLTPPRTILEQKRSPAPQSRTYKEHNFEFDAIIDALTPNTATPSPILRGKQTPTPTRVVASQLQTPTRGIQVQTPTRGIQVHTPTRGIQVQAPTRGVQVQTSSKISLGNSPTTLPTKYSRPRMSGSESPFNVSLKDDDSLTSCPPFSVPSYMAPTVSAKAKVRANSNPKERFPTTPSSESKRRISFPLSQGIGSFKWNKGSFFSNKDTSSQRMLAKDQSLQSIGNLSVDSTVSLPAGVGRKPFNRFV